MEAGIESTGCVGHGAGRRDRLPVYLSLPV